MKRPISDKEFWELVDYTNLGRSAPDGQRTGTALDAAYLYLVDGMETKAEAARFCGVSRVAVGRAISRLELADEDRQSTGIKRLWFDVPHRRVPAVRQAVRTALKRVAK